MVENLIGKRKREIEVKVKDQQDQSSKNDSIRSEKDIEKHLLKEKNFLFLKNDFNILSSSNENENTHKEKEIALLRISNFISVTKSSPTFLQIFYNNATKFCETFQSLEGKNKNKNKKQKTKKKESSHKQITITTETIKNLSVKDKYEISNSFQFFFQRVSESLFSNTYSLLSSSLSQKNKNQEKIEEKMTKIIFEERLIQIFYQKFLGPYVDFRLSFFEYLSNICNKFVSVRNKLHENLDQITDENEKIKKIKDFEKREKLFSINAFEILQYFSVPEKRKDVRVVFGDVHEKNLMIQCKFQLQKTWTSFLQIRMSEGIYLKAVSLLGDELINQVPNPLVFHSFLERAYHTGGIVSILSLKGLFVLINEYNLEYPEFYEQLYLVLFEENVLETKYRTSLFQFLELFLTSKLLPTYILCSFVKKLVRLCLYSSPSGICLSLAFIYNLMLSHPQLTNLIHRTPQQQNLRNKELESEGNLKQEEKQKKENGEILFLGLERLEEENDPYDDNEKILNKTNAIHSSLWEINVLSHHYSAAVIKMINLFEKPFGGKPKLDMTPYHQASYHLMIETDVKRNLTETGFNYQFSDKLFGSILKSDNSNSSESKKGLNSDLEIQNNLLSLWKF